MDSANAYLKARSRTDGSRDSTAYLNTHRRACHWSRIL